MQTLEDHSKIKTAAILLLIIFVHLYRWSGAPCGKKNSIIRDGLVEKKLV